MIHENESPLDTIQRHLREMNEDILGWEAELHRPKTQQNPEYRSCCEARICICRNTFVGLEKDMTKLLDD